MEQIAIFCDTDDFCKAYEEYCRNRLLMDKEEVVPRTRMSLQQFHYRQSRKNNNRKHFFAVIAENIDHWFSAYGYY